MSAGVQVLLYNGENGRLAVMMKHEAVKENQILVLGPEKIKLVIENLEEIVPNMNVAVLQVFDCQFSDFSSNKEICRAFRNKLTASNIPYCFITEEQATMTTMLFCAKVDVKFGENIIVLLLHGQKLRIYEYEFTENGYKKLKFDVLDLANKQNILALRERVNSCDPKYVLISPSNQSNPLLKSLEKVLKEPRVYFFKTDIKNNRDSMLVEMSKWVLDKNYVKYYVIPSATKSHKIMNTACEELITVDPGELLPLTKSCIVPKSVDVLFTLQQDGETGKFEYNGVEKMEQKCHRNTITFTIDSDNVSTLVIEQIMLPQIESLRSKLNKTVKSKNPVIGFCDNFSVICVYKEDGNGYKFVKEWNGIYGNELVINFGTEKPRCGEEALKGREGKSSMTTYSFSDSPAEVTFCMDQKKPIFGKTKTKPYCSPIPMFNKITDLEPGYVVYDLIKIMSMPVDAIEMDDRWGFKFTKDEDHPVLLEFKTHDDTFKQASPAFLLAIILKENIKMIRNEVGEKPKELDFCILDEKYSKEEKERIKNGLQECCKLLKIKCNFVEI